LSVSFSLVEIEPKHLNEVVKVHVHSFPGFFLTFLGPRFLREFYKSFTYDVTGVGFSALDNDKGNIVGVIVGPVDPAGYFKRLLLRRFWVFCLASISAIVKKPRVIKRLFRAVFYRGEAPSGPKRALLSSIAVSPDYQKKGVGKLLVSRWMEEVKNRGATGCYLTTDAYDNDPVNSFYQNLGWTVESTYETPEGRKMNRYVYDFKN
jgi:GNAT superfamily N-acetyltransferase